MSEKAPKRDIDWSLIEVEYRAGVKSVRQIAEENGVSHVAIGKKAKANKWARDLAAQIKAKADAKVSKAAVTAEVTAAKVATEQVVVEANAELQFRIRMAHRTDIGRTRALFGALLGEIEGATHGREGFDALVDEARRLAALASSRADDEADVVLIKGVLGDIVDTVRKLVGVNGRIDSAKKLTEMLEKLVRLEREAFGIRDDDDKTNAVDEILKGIAAEKDDDTAGA